VIAEGEVLQLMNMHDASLDEAGYLRVIRSKTAKLFEASARLGAVLAGAPPALEEACADYGQALGTAFQVIDDVLDYAATRRRWARTWATTCAKARPPCP
jgi:octaprenyl-diphosphate synthase